MNAVNDPFILGVNYWPRKTGLQMWKQFSKTDIREDFSALAKLGINTVRIFLLWEDFQNIIEFGPCQWSGKVPVDVCSRLDWEESADTVSPEMLSHFDEVLEVAKETGLRLIPTLLCTWMSGIIVEPSFVRGRDIFSDPSMLRYQTRYVACFAKRYKNNSQIFAWDLGNEQNCAASSDNPDTGWLWTHLLAEEIHRWDPNHLITSGMHSLNNTATGRSGFAIRDVAESVDFLCVHPYPMFFPDECPDRSDNIRTGYLASFQNKLYEGISGKPVMAEEFGTLGTSYMSEANAARYVQTVLHRLYECGSMGALYWCAFDFECRHKPPYNYCGMEVELGALDKEGRPNLVGLEIQRFAQFIVQSNKRQVRKSDAAIVVPWREENQSVLFNAYVLAQMAGMDPDITVMDDPFKDYRLLFFPSAGSKVLKTKDWDEVMTWVADGGTAYFSFNGMQFPEVNEFFGVEIQTWQKGQSGPVRARYTSFEDGNPGGGFDYTRGECWRLVVLPTDSEVLAETEDGLPLILGHRYGKGIVYLVTEPIELHLSRIPDVFPSNRYYEFYARIGKACGVLS